MTRVDKERAQHLLFGLVHAKASPMRRRGAIVLALVAGIAALLVVLLKANSSGSSDRLANEPTASPTTSRSALSEPSSASTEPAPAALDPLDSSSAADDGLQLDVELLDDHPILDSDIRFRITVTAANGSLTGLTVSYWRWPRGLEDLDLMTASPCGEPGPSSTSVDVAVPVTLLDAANLNGNHFIQFSALEPIAVPMTFTATTSSSCEQSQTASRHEDLRLGFGNGPTVPTGSFAFVAAGQDVAAGQAAAGAVSATLSACDDDGVANSLTIDWGDATPVVVEPWGPVYGCGTGPLNSFDHVYAEPGTYSISLRVRSTDDQGGSEQHGPPVTQTVSCDTKSCHQTP